MDVPLTRPTREAILAGREATMEPEQGNEFKVKGEELLRKVRDIVHEGNVRRIIIKDEKGETFIEIPLTVGVVGALFLPVLAAVGALAALASNFTLQVVRKDDEGEEKEATVEAPKKDSKKEK
jgi:hypothetical protein